MKVDLFNKEGKKTSQITLNDKVFAIKPNEHTIYLSVKSELAAKRQGTSSSKTRSEVSGGGAKPWKQKGTGRARVGSSRNPSRVHGGSAFGPEPRSYVEKVNKKVKSLARKSALSQKIKSTSFRVVDDLSMDTFKTKEFNRLLTNLKVQNQKLTLIVGKEDKNLFMSCRNLKDVNLVSVKNVSTYDIVNSNMLLFDQASVKHINEGF